MVKFSKTRKEIGGIEMKVVFLVTHGKTDNNPDPGMTADGFEAIRKNITPQLPDFIFGGPAKIVCGVGKRQVQVLQALGFQTADANFCECWGGAPTLVKTKPGDPKQILLGDGTVIAWNQYDVAPMAAAIKAALVALPDGALICSGRPVLVRLGIEAESCENGALYELHIDEGELLEATILIHGINLSQTA